MTTKFLWKILDSLFCKDYRGLKLVFLIFASLLILQEFFTYIVVKPTYTTNMRRKLANADFPCLPPQEAHA